MTDNSFILYHYWCLYNSESAFQERTMVRGRKRKTRGTKIRNSANCPLGQWSTPTWPYLVVDWESFKNTDARFPNYGLNYELNCNLIHQGCGLVLGLSELPGQPWCMTKSGSPYTGPRECFLLSGCLSLSGFSKMCPCCAQTTEKIKLTVKIASDWVVMAMVDCVGDTENDFSWFSDVRMIGAPQDSGGVLKKTRDLETKQYFYVLSNWVAY